MTTFCYKRPLKAGDFQCQVLSEVASVLSLMQVTKQHSAKDLCKTLQLVRGAQYLITAVYVSSSSASVEEV